MSASHKGSTNLDNKLKISILLNFGFSVFEFILGIISGSLALISDAAHNLTDSFSLIISFVAQRIARRNANTEHTYGYGRATILAALLNGFILFLLAFYIFYEAYERLQNPEPVEGGIVIIVAFVGVIINFSIASLFRHDRDDLNIRSAYTNMLFDAVASIGAVIAGILIIITKMPFFDSIISILIGLLLLRGSWGVVRDAIHVLLEGVPLGLDPKKIKEMILNSQHVKGIDDLHIWAISSKHAALSCHIIIEDCDVEESIKTVQKIKKQLAEKFSIQHATIETELIACDPKNV